MATTLTRPASHAQTQQSTQPPGAPAGGSKPGEDELNPYRWIILIAVLTGAFLELLDTTSVNVALRQMAGNLGATTDEIGWVATGYILSNVIVLPLTAWLSSTFGRKNYLTTSILIFTFASIMCGLSNNLGELVFWRIVQGAGGAALLSTAQAALREVFPANQQGMIQALYIVVVVTGPTVGPTFGGWITDNYDWQWIFLGKAPIGFLAAFLVWRYLTDSAHVQKSRADWIGIVLLAAGLGALQYVLEEGERYDWFDDVWITRLTVIAVVSMAAFLFWELSPRNKQPVVNLRILKKPQLSAGCVLLFVGGAGIYGGAFLLPLFVQNILGFSPTSAGLLFLPAGIATIIATVITGRLLNGANPLLKPPILIAIGMLGFSLSQWNLGHITPQSGVPDINQALIIRGAGLGLFLTPVTVASLNGLKGIEIAQGSGLTNLFRQLGGSFGIAIVNTYVTNQTQYHRDNLIGSINSDNLLLQFRQQAAAQNFLGDSYSPTASHAVALGVINASVQAQAVTLAYENAFVLLALAFAVASPALFLFGAAKKSGGGGVSAADAAH